MTSSSKKENRESKNLDFSLEGFAEKWGVGLLSEEETSAILGDTNTSRVMSFSEKKKKD